MAISYDVPGTLLEMAEADDDDNHAYRQQRQGCSGPRSQSMRRSEAAIGAQRVSITI